VARKINSGGKNVLRSVLFHERGTMQYPTRNRHKIALLRLFQCGHFLYLVPCSSYSNSFMPIPQTANVHFEFDYKYVAQ
jgi:hypothetical protein